VRFASVGVLNTAVDFGVYVALFTAGMSPVPANFISTSTGLAVSFLGNSRYVFRSAESSVRQVVLFVVTAGIGIWLIQPLVITAVTAVATSSGLEASALVGAVAKLAAIAVAAVWNYALYSRVVFRRRSRTGSDGPAA
jgi:putative flippase GtrA